MSTGANSYDQEDVFQAYVHCIPDATIILANDGTVAEWNPAAEKLLGWDRRETIGKPLAMLDVEQRSTFSTIVDFAFEPERTAGAYSRSLTLRTREKASLSVRILVVNPFGEEAKTRSSRVIHIQDLSEQSRTERTLARQSVELELLHRATQLSAEEVTFEEALETCLVRLGEFIEWPIGHVVVPNSAGNRLVSTGIWCLEESKLCNDFKSIQSVKQFESGQDLVGRIWKSGQAAWIMDVTQDENIIGVEDMNRLGIRTAFGFPVIISGDTVAVIEFYNTQTLPPDAHLLRLARSIGHQLGNLFSRMRAQEERTRMAAIVESSGDAIIGTNLQGEIVSWNPGATEMYGWTFDEAMGQDITILLPSHSKRVDHGVHTVLETGKRLNRVETVRKSKSGKKIYVSTTVSPVRNSSGRIIGTASIERDITQRLKRIKDLREARDAAEEANRTRGEFLANVSHELRTPMNAILGMLDLALQDDLQEPLLDYLTTAKDSADSLLLLVNDILDFSRLEAGRFELEPVPFNLRDLLDEAIKTLSVSAYEKGLELACRVGRGVPRYVVGDPIRLRQVITNLAGNAIKFTEVGEVVVEVQRPDRDNKASEEPLEPGDEVELKFCVADTGIGISAEDQQRIFAPFTQADASTTRQYSGSGLGLAICHELTELMGGTMWLDSVPGTGSKFYFSANLEVAKPTVSELELEQANVDQLRDLPVLVVDDNQTNLQIIQEMLKNWSMKPTAVDSAEQALQLLDTTSNDARFPLVIVDALMPETDGFMLLEKARERGSLTSAAILMLSSADRQVFNERCNNLKVSAYLEKPISQSDLLDTIMTALQGPFFKRGAVKKIDTTTSTLNILVAEDVPANQKVILSILKRRGHNVTIANNGREALDILRAKTFDLVLMDVQMPTMDGLQATRTIRKKEQDSGKHTPIIAMTAHAMRGDRQKCIDAGMDNYIAKPINSQKLLRLVEMYADDMDAAIEEFPPNTSWSIPDPASRRTQKHPEIQPHITEHLDSVINMDSAIERIGGDTGLLADMVSYFFEDAPGLLSQIRQHLDSNQLEEASRAAHSLKGLCSNFDAKKPAELARKVERMASEGNIANIDQVVDDLEIQFGMLVDCLREWQKNNRGNQS